MLSPISFFSDSESLSIPCQQNFPRKSYYFRSSTHMCQTIQLCCLSEQKTASGPKMTKGQLFVTIVFIFYHKDYGFVTIFCKLFAILHVFTSYVSVWKKMGSIPIRYLCLPFSHPIIFTFSVVKIVPFISHNEHEAAHARDL